MRGIGNKGTGEWHRPQGVRRSSVEGCKNRLWQVWMFLAQKLAPLVHLKARLVSSVPVHCGWLGVACCVLLCAAAAAEVEAVAVVVATGDSGADAGAVDAAGERIAPVAVETEIWSTQQDAACGRVGPGRRTQGATALAAPSHPGDGLQDGWEAQRAGPPAEQRDPEAEEELAAGGLAWQQRNQGADSGAVLYDLYLLYKKKDLI